MENTINTTKYSAAIKTILIMIAFVISVPVISYAQEVPIDVGSPYIYDQPTAPSFDPSIQPTNDFLPSYNSDPVIPEPTVYSPIETGSHLVQETNNLKYYSNIIDGPNGGFNDFTQQDNIDYSAYITKSTNNYADNSNNYSIPFNNYNSNYYPSNYSSNLYSLGNYSSVYSGGYYGSDNVYSPSSGTGYYKQSASTVTSGGYVGSASGYTAPTGYTNYNSSGSNYVLPSTYYAPLASTVSSGNYSGVGLTSQVVPNQVLAYTDTNPSVSSVYLSDIPNTGFEDYYGTIIFISLLMFWSAILAYLFLNKRIKSQVVSVEVSENKIESDVMYSSINSNLINKINSDISDIIKVEEYARLNKVLLSSDAAAKIVKLSRLGKINASEYIRSVAIGEWVAVGEDKIS